MIQLQENLPKHSPVLFHEVKTSKFTHQNVIQLGGEPLKRDAWRSRRDDHETPQFLLHIHHILKSQLTWSDSEDASYHELLHPESTAHLPL